MSEDLSFTCLEQQEPLTDLRMIKEKTQHDFDKSLLEPEDLPSSRVTFLVARALVHTSFKTADCFHGGISVGNTLH